MESQSPFACSLDTGEFQRRLTDIAAVGSKLISRTVDGGRHLLRFPTDAATRRQLQEIVAAEAQCCTFLALSLDERDDELVLSISAPDDAEAVAAGLAESFGGSG